MSFGQEGDCNTDPQTDEDVPATTTSIGCSRIRYEAARGREADKCHDAGQLGTNRHFGGGLGMPVNVEGGKDGRDGRCQGDMLLRLGALPAGEHIHGEHDECKNTAR